MVNERRVEALGSAAAVEPAAAKRRRAQAMDRGSWPWVVTAGASALVTGVALLAGVWFLQRPLAIFFIALTIAAALAPVVGWLKQWLPGTLAVVVAYLTVASFLFLLGALVFPPLVEQAGRMAERVPELADRAQQWIQRTLPISDARILDQIVSQVAGLGSSLVSLPLEISSSILDIFLVAFISVYALIAAPHTHQTILSLVPVEREEKVNHTLRSLVHTMGGYIRAVSITGGIIGTLSYVGLLLIGVNFPLALAIVSGVSEFIPFIGPFVSGGLMVIVAFLQSPTKALITLVFVIGLQQLEGNLIAPNVMHPQTCISPLTAVFALFAGASVGGVLGALIAVPLAAAIRVLVVELLLPAIRRQTGAEKDETMTSC
jgi:predicted PurR-regulated permease PerM